MPGDSGGGLCRVTRVRRRVSGDVHDFLLPSLTARNPFREICGLACGGSGILVSWRP
jgi:hypothetical protein